MTTRSRARWLSGLLILLASAPAAAYLRSGGSGGVCLWWPSRSLSWSIALGRAGAPPACDAADTLAAASAAFSAWTAAGEASCTDLTFAGPTTDPGGVGFDPHGPNSNLVVFRKGACSLLDPTEPCIAAGTCPDVHGCWDDPTEGDRSILALTTVSYRARDGAILDADVEVNDWDGGGGAFVGQPVHGWYLTCSDAGPICTGYGQSACRYVDLGSVLTHEVGHVIGLGHVAEPGATMNPSFSPGDTSRRTLAADDVAGVCAVYPPGERSPICAVEASGCGCTTGGAGLAAFLLVAGALRGCGRRRRSAPRSPPG